MKTYFRKYFLLSSVFFILFSIFYALLIRDYVPFNDKGDFILDGRHYANITKHFPELIQEKKLSTYDLRRLGPSLIVRGALQALNLEFSNVNIRNVFYVLNSILILGSLFFYFKLAENFNLSRRVTLLGLIGIFSGFFLFKMSFFYPNNTDLAAFMLGAALLYYYRTTNAAGILACLILGELTWPTLSFYAVLLFVLPRSVKVRFGTTSLHWKVLIGLLLTGFFLFLFRTDNYLLYQIYFNNLIQQVASGTHPINNAWLPVSLVLFFGGAYLFLSSLTSKVSLNQFHVIPLRGVWLRGVIGLALLAGFSFLRDKYGFAGGAGWRGILRTNLTLPIIEPGIFFVAHIMYFGPIIFLILFHLKKTFSLMKEDGLALLLIFGSNFSLFFTPESRCFIPLLPILAMYALKTWENKKIGTVPFAVFTSLGLLLSKIYLNMGSNMDLYSMNAGPWMPDGYILPVTLSCIAATLIFYFGFMRQVTSEAKVESAASNEENAPLETPALSR